MGLAGWLRNLEYLGCRDSIHSYLNTMEFIQPMPLFPFQLPTNRGFFLSALNM